MRLFAYGPADALHPKTTSSVTSVKSRLVLPCWYWLTQVVLEMGVVEVVVVVVVVVFMADMMHVIAASSYTQINVIRVLKLLGI